MSQAAATAPGTQPLAAPATAGALLIDMSGKAKDLGSDDDGVAAEAIDALVAQGPSALPIVTAVLQNEPATARQNALEVLKTLKLPQSVPVLVEVLGKDDDPDIRYETAVLLGQLADPRAREVVEAALRNEEWGTRTGAARACATLCTSPEAVDRLVWMAIFDQPVQPGIWARSSLVKMLAGKPADPAATDLPAQVRSAIAHAAKPALAGDRPLDTRVRAALLLSDIGDKSGLPALRDAASEQSLDVILMPYPLYALGQIGDASAVPALSRALENQRPEVSAFAYDALRRLAARNQPGAAKAMAAFKGAKPPAEIPSPLP